MSLDGRADDAGGTATVTLDADVIVTVDVTLGGQMQCLKFRRRRPPASLHCCGGHAVGMTNTRDSNTGGVPTTGGQSNGPAVQLGNVGTGGIGDLLMAFQLRQAGGADGLRLHDRDLRRRVDAVLDDGHGGRARHPPRAGRRDRQFAATGQPFDCSAWTTGDGPGTFVSADTALNAVPNVDGGNVRKLDD